MPSIFDAIVIGTGQAGPPLAARLAHAGMKVAVVEKHRFGGTCVNDGCTPTKAMIASAYAAHMARRARDYGVMLDASPRVDMKQVKVRKDEIVRGSRDGVEQWMQGLNDATVYRGHARFVGQNAVRVNDDELSADMIFVDVGGRPRVPKMPGLDSVAYLTNVTMMDLDCVPEHLVVVGGSYVGLEFAQMMRRFGSRVTVVEMGPRLVAREDEDVSLAIQDFLHAEGLELRLGAQCVSVRKEADGLSVGLQCTEGAPRESATHLLLAIGRVPNTDDLGLERADIRTDKHGYIEVDEALRTSNPSVWALGDCNGKGAFTHTAYNDYKIVAANVLDGDDRKVTDRITAYALFIDPPLGRGGMTEAQALQDGHKILIGKRPMTRVGRAVEKGETQGFMKVVVDAESKAILGAAILGVGGDEVVHTLLDAMYAGAPYTTIQRAMHIHPTVAELVPTVLGELKTPERAS